jgi:hypothetical protein
MPRLVMGIFVAVGERLSRPMITSCPGRWQARHLAPIEFGHFRVVTAHEVSAAPVLVIDLRAVFCRDRVHRLPPFPSQRWSA